MNSLVSISNDELIKASDEKRRRQEFMLSDAGKARARSRITGMIEYLNLCGYKIPDGDYHVMADIWMNQLEDIIVAYGFDVLHEAVESFVKNDHREYRQMPNAGQIIEVAKRIGYNPDAELARRQHEDEVARLEQEKADEVAKEMTDEKRRELMARFPNLTAVKEIWG